MKKVILISLVTLIIQACGKAPLPITPALPTSTLVSSVLACEVATTLPASKDPIVINYTLETYEDGHMVISCNSPYPDLIVNLTCLQTNPYNYSFQYNGGGLTLETMNVTVSPTNTVKALVDTTPTGVTSSQSCRVVTYPN